MKRLMIPVLAGLAIAGCGKSAQQIQTNPQAQKDVLKAESIYQRCVPNPFVLTKRSARLRAVACMVPPQNRVAFEQCLTKGLLNGHIPTKGRIENVTLVCIGRYA